MSSKPWLAMLLATGLLSACMTPSESRTGVNIPLQATKHNAGRIAQVSLTAQDGATSMCFFIGGVPQGVTYPVRLYTFVYPGSCDQLGAAPAYAMNQTVVTRPVTRRRGWTLSKSVPVALSKLRAGDYAIVVRTSPANASLDIFCGNIH
jgi:hypothetical protein